MTYELIHDVRINDIKYKITSVVISKSIASFTNTATITVPKRLRLNNEDIFSDIDSFIIKKGDVVKIKLGYRTGIQDLFDTTQFNGFVSEIVLGENTVDIVCEDFMLFLKKTKFNLSTPSISLKALGQKIVAETNKNIPVGVTKINSETNGIDLTITGVQFENVTGVGILEHLKEEYTLDSFFIGNQLNIGVNYNSITTRTDSNVHTFSMLPRDLIRQYTDEKFLFIIDKSGLNYQKEEDVKLKIKAKIFKSNSEFVEKESGDDEGEERTFIFTGNPNEKEIQKLIDNQLKRLKYSGFQRGSSFTSFGKPDINPLDIVSFDGIGFVRWYDTNAQNTSKINLYQKTSFLVESVEITFDENGFRQNIGLAQKVSVDEGNSISEKVGKTREI